MPTKPKTTASDDEALRPAQGASGAQDEERTHAEQPDELSGLSYEQAREELMRVVQQLESGGAPLAESLALWERGERLAGICQDWLDGAKAKIEAAAEKRSGGGQHPGE